VEGGGRKVNGEIAERGEEQVAEGRGDEHCIRGGIWVVRQKGHGIEAENGSQTTLCKRRRAKR
jgi:hypothetical protein